MENIYDKGVLISLESSIWTGKVKLPASVINKDADPAFISAHKRLVDKNSLKPIERVRNECRAWLYNKSLPFPVKGVLFIPKEMMESVDKRLAEFAKDFSEKTDEFCDSYEVFMERAKSHLRDLFNPTEYPQNIRQKFGLEWRYFVIDNPGKSHMVSTAMYEREKAKFQDTMEEFRHSAIGALRDNFLEMLDRMVNRLDGDKVFRDTTIENMREFLEDFSKLDINGDKELGILVEKATKVLTSDIKPNDLRVDKKLKADVHEQMKQVQALAGGSFRTLKKAA